MIRTRWSAALDRLAQDCSGVERYEFDRQDGMHILHSMPGFVFVTRHKGCDDDLLCDTGRELVAQTVKEMSELIERTQLDRIGCGLVVS